MSEVQTVSATVHEIAHSKLHNQKKIQIANDEQYQEIELFDKLGLFSNGRIARDNLPEGVYCYDLRGSDYDPGDPVCVEERVVVNHAGSVLMTEPLELTEDGRLMLTEEKGLNFTGDFSTLSQFCRNRGKIVTRKKWRLKASPMQSANILASRLEKIALAILPVGVRARN